MANFIRNTQVKAMTSIWTAKQKARELAGRTKEALANREGQGTLDVAITVLISIVLGALILAGLYLIVDSTVLPTITQRIKDMKRPGKPEGQYYLSHQTLDTDHGVILGVTVTPGDVHDSVPYLDHLEQIHRDVLPIQAATADAAYDFPLAHRVLEEQGIPFYVRPQPFADRTKADKRDAFSYDEEKDVYHCPNGKELRVKGLYRSASGVYWEYWADRGDCQSCPSREKCLSENDKRGARRLLDTYFRPTVRRHLARQNEPDYLEALRKRQIWCEGTFAAQKWGHNLTRVLRRGLEAAEDHCLLSATALNLKRMIKYMG